MLHSGTVIATPLAPQGKGAGQEADTEAGGSDRGLPPDAV